MAKDPVSMGYGVQTRAQPRQHIHIEGSIPTMTMNLYIRM